MGAREDERWADGPTGLPQELRDAVRAARQEGPDAGQLDRIVAGVEGALSPQHGDGVASHAGGEGAGSSAAMKPALALTGKLTYVGIAILTSALALMVWLSARPQPRSASPVAIQATTPAPRAAAPQPSEAALPTPPNEPVQAVPASPEPERPVAVDESTATESTGSHGRRAARRESRAPSADSAASDPVEEARLLREVKRALGAQPERTEALLREHRERFPRGYFVEEREALQIEALWKTRRASEARARAARFKASYPQSPYERRLDDLLQGRLDDPRR